MQNSTLIIRGDDAGASDGANRAILEACAAGGLCNVSVMACGPAFPAFAEKARGLTHVCFGLHVTLNCEWNESCWGPILGPERVPSLVRSGGAFRHTPMDHHTNRFLLEEAIAEVRAQLLRLRTAGLTPYYLDEHMGVGWLPGLRDALDNLARTEGLFYLETAPFQRLEGAPDKRYANAAAFQTLLTNLHGGPHLLITHPTYTEPHAQWPGGPDDALTREADRLLLLDPRLPQVLNESGVESVTVAQAF